MPGHTRNYFRPTNQAAGTTLRQLSLDRLRNRNRNRDRPSTGSGTVVLREYPVKGRRPLTILNGSKPVPEPVEGRGKMGINFTFGNDGLSLWSAYWASTARFPDNP